MIRCIPGSSPLSLRMAGFFLTLTWAAAAGWPTPLRGAPLPDSQWLRPQPGSVAPPVWGRKDGLSVGLWPAPGPRGLLRIYTPYLGQQFPQMVNFISVEPVVRGRRGQSELEVGRRSGRRGMEMYAADSMAGVLAQPRDPSPGKLIHGEGPERLTFYVATEPFRNGAHPVIQVTLRADRPQEASFRVFAAPDSAPMDACVLSATMGNYGRLRRLWLEGEVVDARKLWPSFTPDRLGFAPWRQWGRERLLKRGRDLFVAASPDEADPSGAAYDPSVPRAWHYQGRPATHYWRTADRPGVVARVNGRTTYWGSNAPLPGGVAYENFEVEAPFVSGQEFRFGVTPETPETLDFRLDEGQKATGRQ